VLRKSFVALKRFEAPSAIRKIVLATKVLLEVAGLCEVCLGTGSVFAGVVFVERASQRLVRTR